VSRPLKEHFQARTLDAAPGIGVKSLPERDPFRYCVALFAIAASLLIIFAGYLTDRQGGDDELSLFNPTYMDLHYGKATYPAYGFFESMPVHPPIHYKVIALFMRAGLTLYYAEATPTILLMLACVFLIVTSSFRSPVKVAFLFGLCFSFVFFMKPGAELFSIRSPGDLGDRWVMELFGMRPEGHVLASWLAGLLTLETGRQRNCAPLRLFLGSILLTYAAGMQYYAVIAVLGCGVYAGFACYELKWPGAMRAVAAIFLGCLLYGAAESLFWGIPQREDIVYMIRGTGTAGGIVTSVKQHIQSYKLWASQGLGVSWLRLPFYLGLPVVLISTPILLAIRSTRSFVIAALPIQLFILFFAWHKHAYYYIHEIQIYAVAITAGLLIVLDRLLGKIPHFWLKNTICLLATAYLIFSLALPAYWRSPAGPIFQERVHPQEVARAAGRAMLGPNARVGGRLGLWYASGAADWFSVGPRLLWPQQVSQQDAARYLGRFDAVVESSHMSDDTLNSAHKALLSWYLDGTLRLRGFFLDSAHAAASYLIFKAGYAGPVQGYGVDGQKIEHFVQASDGDYEFIAAVGPYGGPHGRFAEAMTYSDVFPLPVVALEGKQVLVAGVSKRSRFKSLPPAWRTVADLPLRTERVELDSLIRVLRREDRPIRFHQSGVPAAEGQPGGAEDIEQDGFNEGPPAGSVSLTNVIRAEELRPAAGGGAVQRSPYPVITAGAGMGSYAATDPIHAARRMALPCWIEIRAKVLKGRVGFSLIDERGELVADTALLGDTHGREIEVYMKLPSLIRADRFLVRSGRVLTQSSVEIERILVWVTKEDWERDKGLLVGLK
jgi:hypothetical protein